MLQLNPRQFCAMVREPVERFYGGHFGDVTNLERATRTPLLLDQWIVGTDHVRCVYSNVVGVKELCEEIWGSEIAPRKFVELATEEQKQDLLTLAKKSALDWLFDYFCLTEFDSKEIYESVRAWLDQECPTNADLLAHTLVATGLMHHNGQLLRDYVNNDQWEAIDYVRTNGPAGYFDNSELRAFLQETEQFHTQVLMGTRDLLVKELETLE